MEKINVNTKPQEEGAHDIRPFASGSRQAPDPYDQYLERKGYYRKHVPRGCLFRTFSEQVFDVQLYHEKVRMDALRWMRIRSEEYKKKIAGDFDDYLTEMSKPRSYGSFVELHALAHAYRRNVLLFEPYNLGTWFVKDECYQETVMIFFSPDKHFDSIFPTPFIQQAAYCQALVYEILYVKVFKLPDVMYSVERMLHDPEGKALRQADHTIEDRVVTPEGRQFVFDTAEETECVLDNYLLCHFHNKDNFDSIVDTYRNKKSGNDSKETRNTRANGSKVPPTRELINPMLCDRKISCVRQLLKEGITPFPYKVAKALDPNIYRNIEFDSWSDMRRELKYRNWYFEQNCLQVGAKCLVRLNDSDDRMLYGYIQEMSPDKGPCVVYVEEVAECRTLPYDRLQPLSPDHTRLSTVPYKCRRSTALHHFKITCSNHSRKKMLKAMHSGALNTKAPDNEMYQYYTPYYESEKPYRYTIKNFTSMNNFHPGHYEMMVMPFTTASKSKSSQAKIEPGDINERSTGNENQTDGETTYSSSGVYDLSASSSMSYTNPQYCYTFAEPFPYDPSVPSAFCALPYSAQQVAFAPPGPYGAYYGAPYSMMTPLGDIAAGHRTMGDEIPNFQAVASAAPNGSDLPLHDLVTLRYFYNLGVEYFRNNQFRLEPPAVTHSTRNAVDVTNTLDDENEVKELAYELKQGMNLNATNANDAQNKQRGSFKPDNHQNTKRKYGTKNPKKLTPNRNRVNTPETGGSVAAPNPCLDGGQSTPTSNADHLASDVSQASYDYTPIPYSHVPMMPPVRVPYYAVDSSHYMIPSYGHGFMAPSDVMLIHENTQPPALNPLEAQYPPMVFASPPVGTGYAIMGYPQPSTHLNPFANGNNNAENDCNDAAQ